MLDCHESLGCGSVTACTHCSHLFGCNLKRKNNYLRAKTWTARSKTGYCGGFSFFQTSLVLFEIWSCTLATLSIVSGALSWCRTKPDSATRSGRGNRSRCALESAAARKNRTGGLGRYLSVPSASCGLGCRAQIAIKTCRLELTEKRKWVSCSNLISRSSYLFICWFARGLFLIMRQLGFFLETFHGSGLGENKTRSSFK